MEPSSHLLPVLPERLEGLSCLAVDLRWTWNHATDELWRQIDADIWQRTQNPYVVLQNVGHEHLTELAQNKKFCKQIDTLLAAQRDYFNREGWYADKCRQYCIQKIAYFSMEFGIGEALPFYAGGLGVLAGDFLKASSDLCLPVVGVGLLYHQGYFRQMLDLSGMQEEAYPICDPSSLPIAPVFTEDGEWLQVSVELPGRELLVRVWQAHVGNVSLYLLDSNHPLNGVVDRSITSQLYGGGKEMRLLQEIVLGVAGWRALMKLELPIDICHMNEGHAAFVVFERALDFMQKNKVNFKQALWATRAGNVFTTHTPVAAGFDIYEPELLIEYGQMYAKRLGLEQEALLGMGRSDLNDDSEPFNMAHLAIRGSGVVNGVSKLHGAVSRSLFRNLYPRWPINEVPVTHVTNGVHVPSWDSAWSDKIWTDAAGKNRWLGDFNKLSAEIQKQSDKTLWSFRSGERQDLINYARDRYALELGQRGAESAEISKARYVLDPNVLTLGFARRFTAYKRPNLLLDQPERLVKLLTDSERPVQLIIAGKAHPKDQSGKALIQEWVEFIRRSEVQGRVVFLADYDISLAQQMVQGVDVWINTPKRPWEACGTSGMKVLANGGLNLSSIDGWWAEVPEQGMGWSLGHDHDYHEDDGGDADHLYELLENEIVPEFYNRDAQGVPRAWVARMRASMAELAPQFSSNRMVQEYVDNLYANAAEKYHRRVDNNAAMAKELADWESEIEHQWQQIHWGNREMLQGDNGVNYELHVYLGDLPPDWVVVELFADENQDHDQKIITMHRDQSIPGAVNGYLYTVFVPNSRPIDSFTPRIRPYHENASIPQENNNILWWS